MYEINFNESEKVCIPEKEEAPLQAGRVCLLGQGHGEQKGNYRIEVYFFFCKKIALYVASLQIKGQIGSCEN